MFTNSPLLPYATGCRHLSPCADVAAGRACALDDTKRNGYDSQGRAYVEFVTDDYALGIAHGSRLLAVDPYTGYLSGVRVLPSGDVERAYQAGEWS